MTRHSSYSAPRSERPSAPEAVPPSQCREPGECQCAYGVAEGKREEV